MKAFYFGEKEKALYGVYHPSLAEVTRDSGVVLCYPFGREYIKSHRAFRQLARKLSRSGFPVLRFDYFGTGDSCGDADEGSVSQWVEDIGTAIQELKDTAMIRRVSVVGFRMGATLASLAVDGRPDLDALILWDPVVSGTLFLGELEKSSKSKLPVLVPPNGPSKIQCGILGIKGFPLTDEMIRDFSRLDLLVAPEFQVTRVALLTHERRDEYDRLEARLEDLSIPHIRESVEAAVSWDSGGGFSSAVMIPEIQRAILMFLESASID